MAQVEIIAANLKEKNNNITIANKKKRVCAYGRVSTDDEEQITSYNSQIKYYTEKIKSNPDWEFVGIYADEGISGTQVKNRTEFQRMINDALNGKIDIILAKSISRFARNTLDTLKYCRELRDKKVDVYFEKENIHTIDLDSEMFLTLYSAFAQAESESTSQNVKLGLKAMMKRGEYVGSPDCYGYDWNKETKQLDINEEQAEVVRMIFNWYIDGLGSRRIIRKLEELNIPTYKGNKRWSESSIMGIIHQEKYVGDLIQNKSYTVSPITHKTVINCGEKEKYYVKDHHTPIISREVWDKAQEIANKRKEVHTINKQGYSSRLTNKYAFSGKIKCAFCGTNFTRRKSSKSKTHPNYNVYWTCYRKRMFAEDCLDSVGISETKLEETFVMIYNNIIKNKHKTKEALLKAIKDVVNDDDYQDKLNSLLTEKETIEKRLSKIIDMELDDDIDRKALFIQKEKELLEELNTVKTKISHYEMLLAENKGLSKQLKEIDKYFDNFKELKKFNREVFQNMIECIIVGDYDEDGNKLPRVARFVLKTGKEYKFELSNNPRNSNSDNTKNELVPFDTGKLSLFNCSSKTNFCSF